MMSPEKFEAAVITLYRCQGWATQTDVTIAGCQIDLVVKKSIAGITHILAIECTLEHVTAKKFAADFAHLMSIRTQHPQYRLCIVSARGFSRGVKDRAEAAGIDLLTYSELRSSILGFDADQYARALIESRNWADHKDRFIMPEFTWDTTCSEFEGKWKAPKVLDQWLYSRKLRVLTILGDYGTGKTMLCRAIAANLAHEYLAKPFEAPVPIFIELRTVRHCNRLSDAILEHLKSFGIHDVNSGLILSLLEEGVFLLLLDGLDEFVDQYSLAELTRVLLEFTLHESKKAKVILTCRTHYFRSETSASKNNLS